MAKIKLGHIYKKIDRTRKSIIPIPNFIVPIKIDKCGLVSYYDMETMMIIKSVSIWLFDNYEESIQQN